ncbi:MAG: NUDIX hydrolase [Candidatus Nanoarchaeia archaeon]|jgi:8-oxo-dGTP diphosphatase|nr:NUDIX hydrolase [Candidatus Nanoarchaeia archaeon]
MPTDIHDFKNAASTASLIYMTTNKTNKILLIQRDHEPFVGMWALPGGFLNCDQESLEVAGAREFYEETNLVVEPRHLELFMVNSDPKRDPRGHVIDHVYYVHRCTGEPKAKDDARKLEFFDINNLPDLAFDHGKVLEKFIGSTLYLEVI